MSQFITETSSISSLLTKIQDGELGLPEFQRPFKWDRERIRGLLVSILNDYPTGSLLFYCPGDPKLFGRRSIQEAPPLRNTPSVSLALDGQQRLTSLYQALRGKTDVRFYLNVRALLASEDVEDWVTYAVPQWRKRRGQNEWYIRHYWLLTESGKFERFEAAAESSRGLLPMTTLTAEGSACMRWMMAAGFGTDAEIDRVEKLRTEILHNYKLPVITLASGTPPDQVCFIFEKINSSGLMLSLFELLNAKLYRSPADGEQGMNLAKMWETAQEKNERLRRFGVKDLFFLQTLALLRTRSGTAGCKRKNIFAMTVEDVRDLWPRAIAAIDGVLELMEDHAGIRNGLWFAFPTMVPALAVLYDSYHTQLRGKPGYAVFVTKLLRWYWCAVFTNRYTNAIETKLAGDMRAVSEWIDRGDDAMPDVVRNFRFSATSFRHARSRSSAIYQGVFCLVLRTAHDFHHSTPLTWERISKDGTEDHHIFPKATLRGKQEPRLIDCVLNRTLIDWETNRNIRDKLPSVYIRHIRTKSPNIDAILASHAISPGGTLFLERDDFHGFLNEREVQLGALVSEATGGRVVDYAMDPEDEGEEDGPFVPDDLDDTAEAESQSDSPEVTA